METIHSPSRRLPAGFGPLLALLYFSVLALLPARAVPITGANGTTVDFAGVKAAAPEGLQVRILPNGNLATVPWDKFDLGRLESEQPEIFAAYQKAVKGETVGLFLGVFASEKPKEEMKKPEPKKEENHAKATVKGSAAGGFKDLTVFMKRPAKAGIKALLVGIYSGGHRDASYSSRFLGSGLPGPWDKFLAETNLLPVGIELNFSSEDMRKAPFFLAQNGSGEALLQGLKQAAEKLGQPELGELPIVLYGRATEGSAFAYNFTQWKPERVVCAVAVKGGALFTAEPTETSVKVPLLILKGEYDNSYQFWELEPTLDEVGLRKAPPHEAENVYNKTLPMRPNWTLLVEPRGTEGSDPLTLMVGEAFVKAVMAQRFGGGKFADMVPDIAYMGDSKAKSVKNMPEDQGELSVGETWLPDQKFAAVWKRFLEGDLTPPAPPLAQ